MHRKLEKVYYEIRRPRLAWGDIGGYHEAKAALKQMVCLPLQRPDDLKTMNLVPPAGIFLWGPLGTGMAMLPEACATEAGVTYVYVSGREILGKPEALAETLREAEREAPAVLYISDLDWLAPLPGADYSWSPGNERGKPPAFADRALTDTFLRELDRLQQAAPGRLAIIGGSYRIDVVDQALIKDKSRFNRKVFLPPPDVEMRREILAIYLARTPHDRGIDLGEIAAQTEGYVGWDLENVVKKAALRAVEADRAAISREDLVTAIPLVKAWLTPDMTAGYFRIHRADCPHHYNF